MEGTDRLKYIDVAKGIGIILVVWGHTGLVGANQINCFHMAFFFILSGYVFQVNKKVDIILTKKVKSLYIPFVIWQITFILLHNFFY